VIQVILVRDNSVITDYVFSTVHIVTSIKGNIKVLKKFFVLIPLTSLLASCSITQVVEPADLSDDAMICIVENPSVREGFLVELKAVLDEKKIAYKMVDKQGALDCEWSATYLARWSWDMALYMSYAEINVYRNGELDGQAIYDSTSGGANMSKFIDSEPKIRELVESLMK